MKKLIGIAFAILMGPLRPGEIGKFRLRIISACQLWRETACFCCITQDEQRVLDDAVWSALNE